MQRLPHQHGLRAIVAAARLAHQGGRTVVLATITDTQGSSYRKAGARMLLHDDGSVTGILGGGCFEGDLWERSQPLFQGDSALSVRYDMRSDAEILWGLGLGCNGAVDIFLQTLVPDDALLDDLALLADAGGRLATVVESSSGERPRGQSWIVEPGQQPQEDGLLHTDGGRVQLYVDRIRPPPHLLICGAGPDALPLVAMAAILGWRLSVLDHRPAFALDARFPGADRVSLFEGSLDGDALKADAAVVMSHHFETDARYLKALSGGAFDYLGVLGPAARRDALLTQLDHANLINRVHGPVGLDLGGDLPEDIALSILAQIRSVLSKRSAAPLSSVIS